MEAHGAQGAYASHCTTPGSVSRTQGLHPLSGRKIKKSVGPEAEEPENLRT